ncbi:MAG: FAD-dependent oxidoreductase [Hyphomicrobiaceae bacterium]|nr:FAD-dependent oxidoreductase [Hyphomicrobiaceae bacterium]
MSEQLTPDLCVIGAGSGGLSVAAAAAQLGVSVVLIEKHKMGGDCLNYGCVPSKALIAAGRRAQQMRTAKPFGIIPTSPSINHKAVHDHVKEVIAAIAVNDSVERFTGLGVKVVLAPARFVDKTTVAAGDYMIRARRFVIATGSSPAVPPIPGLDSVPYFTNETVFDNEEKLDRLIVIGGGPIGMELAQAHARLGSRVTVLEAMKALGKDDPELTEVVLKHLREEGLEIREATKVQRIEPGEQGVRVTVSVDGREELVEGSHLLVATGRRPNLADLNLDAAGIKHERGGIIVDKGLCTSNSKVFAIGDVTGGLQFTHVANYHAGIVLRRALFRLPAKVNNDIVPWVTYTEPELAHVGLTEDEAKKRHGRIKVLRWPYHENDRAQAERVTEGFVKVVLSPKGKILGASIVGEHAGELIQMWCLAVSQGLNIKAMTSWISPYPTLTEINKRAAVSHLAAMAQNPWARWIVDRLAKLG